MAEEPKKRCKIEGHEPFWLGLTDDEGVIIHVKKEGGMYHIRVVESDERRNLEIIHQDTQRNPFWASEKRKKQTCAAIQRVVPDMSTERFDAVTKELMNADEIGDITKTAAGEQDEDENLVMRQVPTLITEKFIAEEVWDGKNPPRFAVYYFDEDRFDFAETLDQGETDERGRQIIYLPVYNDHVKKGMVLLPREPKEATFSEVFDDAFALVLDPDNFDPCGYDDEVKLNALISVGSWYLDRLTPNIRLAGIGRFAPILSMRGPSGSGKNRLANLLRLLSYRPFFDLSKTKIPSLFRPLDIWKGTLVLDEMDFEKTGETSELTHFLNCRATGTPIGRQNPDKVNVADAFENFGLTIVTQRRSFKDDATEGRSIPFYCEKTESKLPTVELDETVERGLDLQDKLLYLRMKHWREFKIDKRAWLEGIKDPRLNAALLPVIALARFEPMVLDVAKAVAGKIEEAKRRLKANSADGIIINWLWRRVEEGYHATWNQFRYIVAPPDLKKAVEIAAPVTVRDIADDIGWKTGGVRRVLTSLHLAPEETPVAIKVGGKAYRPVWFDLVRFEKQLEDFVPQYVKGSLHRALGIPDPKVMGRYDFTPLACLFAPVTEVTKVTGIIPVGNVCARPPEEVTEVTPLIPPLEKYGVTKVTGRAHKTPSHMRAVTSVTTVTEPTTEDITKVILSYRKTQIHKTKLAKEAGVSMERLQVVVDELANKRAVIDRGAWVEVL